MTSPTAATPPESAMNLNMTFDDLELIHDALIQWAIQVLPVEDAKARMNQFAAFVIRHPELFTVFTVMKGAPR